MQTEVVTSWDTVIDQIFINLLLRLYNCSSLCWSFSASKHDIWHCDLNTLYAFSAALRRRCVCNETSAAGRKLPSTPETKRWQINLHLLNLRIILWHSRCPTVLLFCNLLLLFFAVLQLPCRLLTARDILSSWHVPLDLCGESCSNVRECEGVI